MNKVFITGGAGFIGGHLARRLLDMGKHVTVFDNLTTPINTVAGLQHERYRFVKGDIRNLTALTKELAGHDLVWHLAANTDIPNGIYDSSLDFTNCTVGTWNLLEAMRINKVDEILFASTAAVYGTAGSTKPLVETYGPILPISLYAAGKLSCEGYISAYAHLYGMKAIMFRFGNVIGGGMNHGVIYDLLHKLYNLEKDEPKVLKVWGDGTGRKPFFLVEDCIHGMLVAYDHMKQMEHSAPAVEIYNLGCDTNTSIAWLVEQVLREVGADGCEVKWTGAKQGFPGDVPVVMYNADKIKALGWSVQCDSDTAVAEAIRRLHNKIY